MSEINSTYLREAKVFSRYLIGCNISDVIAERYAAAVTLLTPTSSQKELGIERFAVRFPFWIACLDAAMALRFKEATMRKKILIMFAILETIPEYSNYFLPQKHSLFYIFTIMAVGCRSILRFVFGWILLQFLIKK